MAKVGKGLKGFGNSKGSAGPSSRTWDEGEYLLEIQEATQKPRIKDGDEIGVSVMVKTKCLGGGTQHDDTDPEGKNITFFINVNTVDEDLSFTIDQYKDLFLAADVKVQGDDPAPFLPKLKGKKIVGYAVVKEYNGKPVNNWYLRSLSKSKNFAGVDWD